MTKFHFILRVLIVVCFALIVNLAVQAQATRTWVSGVGDDVNPCSRTAPCKTFAGAISKTAAGGEIDALDPGGFGEVTITKSITIDGGPGVASILAAGVNGINISAAATDTVVIRNLTINGAGTGLKGINYIAGRALIVQNVKIQQFINNLIDMNLTADGRLIVSHFEGSNTSGTGATDAAIHIMTVPNTIIRAQISDSVLSENTSAGILVQDWSLVDVKNTRIVGQLRTNNSQGIVVSPSIAASPASVNIEGCELSHNNVGLFVTTAGGGSITAFVSDTGFYYNGVGAWASGGPTITSFGNNRFGRNASDTIGSFVTTPLK